MLCALDLSKSQMSQLSTSFAYYNFNVIFEFLEQFTIMMHMGKSRNRRTFSKIENLRFLQNYDDYNSLFGIKLKCLIIIFHLKGHAVKLKCVNYKIF